MSSQLLRPFRPSAMPLVQLLARPGTFRLLHSALIVLSFFPQLASWGAKLWWEAGKVPAARFEAWDNYFTGLSLDGFYPWLGLLVTTFYAALVLRQAKAAVLGAFALVASFILMSSGITLLGYE
jgi:hypothetical protein